MDCFGSSKAKEAFLELETVFMKRVVLILAALALLLGRVGRVEADLVVVSPNGNASVEGNTDEGFPFNIQAFGASTMRYQQVYDASDFSAVTSTQYITQIAFRVTGDGFGSAFTATLPNIQIDLSTTAASPDALDPTFANNVGADDKVVYGPGPLALSSVGPDGSGPGGTSPFDVVIALQTPFPYNPANGNLLMDVRNNGGGITVQAASPYGSDLDGEYAFTDSVSRSYTYFGDVNSPTADIATTDGLVTQFTFEPSIPAVPEPASVTLLGMGIASLAGYGWRRRKLAAA
jgi:PEP-CTERM motif